MRNARALSLIVILVLSVECSFLTAPVLSQNTTSQTIQSQGEILYAPPPTYDDSFNAVWCDYGDISLSALVSHKIFNIFLHIGTPVPADHSINYLYTDNQIATMLNTIRAYDSRFKIYAWIGSYPHDASGQIDLSTSGYRQAMINSVVACAQKGFDGIQDNIEDVTAGTTYANQVTYWNALTTALHGVGKECIVYTLPWDWNVNYWSTINADYIAMSMYAFDGTPDSEADFKYYMDLALTKTTSPCLLSMIHGGTGETIADQLGWIGDQITLHGTYSNLAGFALYEYSGILSSEWAAWDTFIAG